MKEVLIYRHEIEEWGKQKLASISTQNKGFKGWIEKLYHWPKDFSRKDDVYVWLSCIEALYAVSEGNYGVGAILLDEKGDVLISDHNKSFYPDFRTDLHAEMVVLNNWEAKKLEGGGIKELDYRLISSLEPCPMCLTRLLYSDIKIISYAAPDNLGGMLRMIDQMPPFFRETAKRHQLGQADASPKLLEAAWKIMELTMLDLNQRVS